MNESIVKHETDINNKPIGSSKLGGILSGRMSGNIAPAPSPDKAFDAMMRSTSPETRNSGELAFVPLDVLLPFPGHPFKLYQGTKLNDLVESIKEIGVVNAIIIRKAPEQQSLYQILSGHNRANAAKIAGLKQIKAEIVDVDDDTAVLIVVDSNFKQRETLLPSERAFGFKMQMDAMKRQGKRVDLFLDDNRNTKSRDLIGEQQGLSGVQIFKYVRLTELIPGLLEMLDAENFSIKAGVDLSYIKSDSQELLYKYFQNNNIHNLDNGKASLLRKTDIDIGLTEDNILEIMSKKIDSKNKSISFKRAELLKYFPSGISNEEIMQKIYALLEKSTV